MTTVRAQPQNKTTIVLGRKPTCPGQIDGWGVGASPARVKDQRACGQEHTGARLLKERLQPCKHVKPGCMSPDKFVSSFVRAAAEASIPAPLFVSDPRRVCGGVEAKCW